MGYVSVNIKFLGINVPKRTAFRHKTSTAQRLMRYWLYEHGGTPLAIRKLQTLVAEMLIHPECPYEFRHNVVSVCKRNITQAVVEALSGKLKPPVPAHKKKTNKPIVDKSFLFSYEWRKIRYEVILRCGPKCQCCGRAPKDGIVLNVDHIKPRKTHPELALDIDNLQVLCNECNHGKGNWDRTDWRPESN